MERKYAVLENGKEEPQLIHIRLDTVFQSYGDTLCIDTLREKMTAGSWLRYAKTKNTMRGLDMCPECTEKFKQSDHPEAVAYRKAFSA